MAEKKIVTINTCVGDLVVAGYEWLKPLPIPDQTKTAMIGTLVQDMRRRNERRRSDLSRCPIR